MRHSDIARPMLAKHLPDMDQPRLNISGKGGDLPVNAVVQCFNRPVHIAYMLYVGEDVNAVRCHAPDGRGVKVGSRVERALIVLVGVVVDDLRPAVDTDIVVAVRLVLAGSTVLEMVAWR